MLRVLAYIHAQWVKLMKRLHRVEGGEAKKPSLYSLESLINQSRERSPTRHVFLSETFLHFYHEHAIAVAQWAKNLQ